MVEKLSGDPIFSNDSPMPRYLSSCSFPLHFTDLATTAMQQMVAHWGGVRKGTVCLITHQVITAVLWPRFMQEAVRYPTDEEKERAKEWVTDHSCRAWCYGWLLVDGTLISLYKQPNWFGESYFNQKCNYSLNIQVSSNLSFVSNTPALCFI
jgi:hypothetical protein